MKVFEDAHQFFHHFRESMGPVLSRFGLDWESFSEAWKEIYSEYWLRDRPDRSEEGIVFEDPYSGDFIRWRLYTFFGGRLGLGTERFEYVNDGILRKVFSPDPEILRLLSQIPVSDEESWIAIPPEHPLHSKLWDYILRVYPEKKVDWNYWMEALYRKRFFRGKDEWMHIFLRSVELMEGYLRERFSDDPDHLWGVEHAHDAMRVWVLADFILFFRELPLSLYVPGSLSSGGDTVPTFHIPEIIFELFLSLKSKA